MSAHTRVDPAIVAYLGAATALLKLWLAESQAAARAFTDEVDSADHPAMAPYVAQLKAIRDTTVTLPLPEACAAAQRAFLEAQDRGIAAYLALVEPGARDQKRVAMLGGVENFALFDAELARLEQRFGPFDTA